MLSSECNCVGLACYWKEMRALSGKGTQAAPGSLQLPQDTGELGMSFKLHLTNVSKVAHERDQLTDQVSRYYYHEAESHPQKPRLSHSLNLQDCHMSTWAGGIGFLRSQSYADIIEPVLTLLTRQREEGMFIISWEKISFQFFYFSKSKCLDFKSCIQTQTCELNARASWVRGDIYGSKG